MTTPGYTTPIAQTVTGATRRQLNYWTVTGLVEPSIHHSAGSGDPHRYTTDDLVRIAAAKTITDAGITLDTAARVLAAWPDDTHTLHTIVINNRTVTFCASNQVIGLVTRSEGATHIVPLDTIRNQIAGRLAVGHPALANHPAA